MQSSATLSCGMRFLLVTTGVSLILSVLAATAADFWLSGRIAVLGAFAGLQYTVNPGIAWGMRLPGGLQEALIILALLAVLYLAVNDKGTTKVSIRRHIGYGCVLGGGVANIIDRFRDGLVTDFIQIGTFPVFNAADSFVTIGVMLLLLETFLSKRITH